MKRFFTLGVISLLSFVVNIYAAALCDFPTGHLDNANFGDANGRILLTIENIGTNQVRLTVKPNYANGATQKLDYLYVIGSSNIGNCTPYPATAGVDESGTNLDEMSVDLTFPAGSTTANFTIQWSNPNWGGRWQANPTGVDLTSACTPSCTDEIYFVNYQMWTTPHAHMWEYGNGSNSTTWNGDVMTQVTGTTDPNGFTIWKATVASGRDHVLFNQTGDPDKLAEETISTCEYYFRGAWYSSLDDIPSDMMYFVNTPNWATPRAHLYCNGAAGWKGQDTSWPGITLTNTGLTNTDGNSIYSFAKGDHTNVLFNQGNDDGKTDQEYYDIGNDVIFNYADNTWYRSHNIYLCGTMFGGGDWSTQLVAEHKFPDWDKSGCTITKDFDLAASTTYDFKIHTDGFWRGSSTGATITSANTTIKLDQENDPGNPAHITTTIAGTYTFIYDVTNAKLTVKYPRSSQCEGDLGHFATPATKRIHYTIEYLPLTNKIRYTVQGYGAQVLDYLEIQTSAGNSGNLTPSIVGGVATWLQTAPAAGTDMGINFVYSTNSIGGNEMNAESVPNPLSFTGNNANLVYYKSHDCEVVEACNASGNLARDKITKAGWARRGGNGGVNAAEDPDKAVDGSLAGNGFVSWGTDNVANNQYRWWAVDLGNEYVLNNIKVYWTNAGWTSNDYVLQVSDNPTDFTDDVAFSNTNWTTIKTVKGTQSNGATANVSEVYATGRYLRLVANDVKNLGLLEFEVFGDACVSDLGGKPTLTGASLNSQTVYSSATLSLTGTSNGGSALHTFLLQDQMGNYRHVTTNASNLVTITGLENKRYTFTVWAYENGVLSDETLTVIVGQEFFDPVQNIAYQKPCVAHASQNGNPASNANDGYLNNLWNHGNGAADQAIPVADRNYVWWYVDLQDYYELRELDVWFEGAAATEFIFQIRNDAPTSVQANDDSEWTTFIHFTGAPSTGDAENAANRFGSGTNPVAAVNALAFKSAFSIIPKGRYVRFRALNATNWDWGVKPREIRIYANGYVIADANPPVMGTAAYVSSNPGNTGAILELHATDEEGDVSSFKIVETGGDATIVSTDGSNRATLDGIATGCAHTYNVYAIDAAGNLSENYTTLTFDFINPAENLALNKTARAGWSRTVTQANAAEVPAKANDGIGGSGTAGETEHRQWGIDANFPTKAWWAVDLGQKFQLSNVDIYWNTGDGNVPHSYIIQVANETPADFVNDAARQNLVWETVKTETNTAQNMGSGTANRNRHTFTVGNNVVARYVRIVNLDETRIAMYLREVEVYAHAIVCDNNAPTMVSAAYTSANASSVTVELHGNDAEDGTDAVKKYKLLEMDGSTPLSAVYVTTNAQHKTSITGLTSGTHTYRVYAVDTDGNVSANYENLSFCYTNPAENLALNKPVETGMQENANTYKAANANNGNLADEWGTGPITAGTQQNVWWYVDLGDVYRLSEIDIFFEGAYSRDFILQVRHTAPTAAQKSDTLQWFTVQRFVGTPKSGASEEQKNAFPVNCKARYIRFQSFAQANDAWGCKIKDFRVYAASCADEDNVLPVITTAEKVSSDPATGSLTLHLGATDNLTTHVTNYIINNITTSEKTEYVVNASNQITLTSLETCLPYSLQIQAKDSAANISAVTPLIVTVTPSTSVNLALSATPTAGYTEGISNVNNAIDGNLATQWQSTGATAGTNEWYTLDLGRMFDINQVKIRWGLVAGADDGGDYPADYRLQISDNNSTWATFVHYNSQTPIGTWLDTTYTDPLPARYVRVWVDRHTVYPMGIREIELYSKDECYVADGKPVITLAEVTGVNPLSVDVHCEAWAAGKTHNQLRYYYELYKDGVKVSQGTKTHLGDGNFEFDGLVKGASYSAKIWTEIISNNVRSDNFKTINFSVTYSSLHYLTEETDCNWQAGLWKPKWQFKYTDNFSATEIDNEGNPAQILSYIDHSFEYITNTAPSSTQYKLYEAGYGGAWTSGTNLFFRSITVGQPLIMYALGTEKFVCNLDELFVAGDAVGGWWTAANNPNSATAANYRMTYDNETGLFKWTGNVTPSAAATFKIVIRDIRGLNKAADTWAYDRIMDNNQLYQRDWNRATLYFDMKTWTWWWESAVEGCAREGGPGVRNTDNDGTAFTDGYRFDTYVQTEGGNEYLVVEAEVFDDKITNAILQFYKDATTTVSEQTKQKVVTYTIGTEPHSYYRFRRLLSNVPDAINGIIRYKVKFEGEAGIIRNTPYHFFDIVNKVCAPDSYDIYNINEGDNQAWTSVTDDPEDAAYELYNYKLNPEHVTGDDKPALIPGTQRTAGGTVVQPVYYRRKFDPGKWHSIILPFEVDSVVVIDEGKPFKIYPKTTTHEGYYWLRKYDNGTAANETAFKGHWTDLAGALGKVVPQKNVPYIIYFPKGDYYEDRYVEFRSKLYQTFDSKDSFTAPTNVTTPGTFELHGNTTLFRQSVGKSYYLNDFYSSYDADEYPEQQYFVQEDTHTLLPFECFIISDSETMARVKIIGRRSNTPTSIDQVLQNDVSLDCITIYSVTGQLIVSYHNMSVNEVMIEAENILHSGCYLLRSNGNTQKIIVGGK